MKESEAYVLHEWRRLMNVSAWNFLNQPSDYHFFQKKCAVWFCKTLLNEERTIS